MVFSNNVLAISIFTFVFAQGMSSEKMYMQGKNLHIHKIVVSEPIKQSWFYELDLEKDLEKHTKRLLAFHGLENNLVQIRTQWHPDTLSTNWNLCYSKPVNFNSVTAFTYKTTDQKTKHPTQEDQLCLAYRHGTIHNVRYFAPLKTIFTDKQVTISFDGPAGFAQDSSRLFCTTVTQGDDRRKESRYVLASVPNNIQTLAASNFKPYDYVSESYSGDMQPALNNKHMTTDKRQLLLLAHHPKNYSEQDLSVIDCTDPRSPHILLKEPAPLSFALLAWLCGKNVLGLTYDYELYTIDVSQKPFRYHEQKFTKKSIKNFAVDMAHPYQFIAHTKDDELIFCTFKNPRRQYGVITQHFSEKLVCTDPHCRTPKTRIKLSFHENEIHAATEHTGHQQTFTTSVYALFGALNLSDKKSSWKVTHNRA